MKNIILFVLISSITVGCSGTSHLSDNAEEQETPKKYTSTFPSQETSSKLKKAKESILRIVSTSYYQNYYFDKPRITLHDIMTNDLEKIADNKMATQNSSAGTAIVLQQNKDRSLLITCAHVVTSPDTTISYFKGERILDQKYIKSIRIKRKQNDMGFSGHKVNSFNMIAKNRFVDLAMLTIKSKEAEFSKFPLSVNIGNSENLQAGSFLYILGYPKGNLMVTRGLASTFGTPEKQLLISDAILNPGISGGLVLASNDGYQTLDWVGMARASTVSKERVLIPRPDSSNSSNKVEPYGGVPFSKSRKKIAYGVSQAIPSYYIASFINNHQKEIARQGFNYTVSITK